MSKYTLIASYQVPPIGYTNQLMRSLNRFFLCARPLLEIVNMTARGITAFRGGVGCRAHPTQDPASDFPGEPSKLA